MKEDRQRMNKTIYGDGNGEKGLVVRTDRLEQKSKFIVWIGGILTTIGLGGLAKILFG